MTSDFLQDFTAAMDAEKICYAIVIKHTDNAVQAVMQMRGWKPQHGRTSKEELLQIIESIPHQEDAP